MPKIIYISHTGHKTEVDVSVKSSVMQGACNHSIDGIVAECGGSCICATCHVYVDDAWIDKLPPKSADEAMMLEMAESEVKENSRLSCQIKVTKDLDGLVIHMPEKQ